MIYNAKELLHLVPMVKSIFLLFPKTQFINWVVTSVSKGKKTNVKEENVCSLSIIPYLTYSYIHSRNIFLSTYYVPNTIQGLPGLGVAIADDRHK